MRTCTRKRERDRGRKGAAEWPDLTEIRSSSSQQWRNWRAIREVWCKISRGERKGDEKGEGGDPKGEFWRPLGSVSSGGKWGGSAVAVPEKKGESG
jgi:hypothetical protein